MNISERKRLNDAAIERVKAIQFGEPVTNICAGECNPLRHGYFVQMKTTHHKNGFGITSSERLARCTDRKGKFWDTGIDVIYPGHLPHAECAALFAPVHAAMYGGAAQQEAPQ